LFTNQKNFSPQKVFLHLFQNKPILSHKIAILFYKKVAQAVINEIVVTFNAENFIKLAL
jgi:hypothetical protein